MRGGISKISLVSVIYAIIYFIICLFFLNSNPWTDEGTHSLIGLFYYDLTNDWFSQPTLSYQKIYDYTINYLVHYPKISLYYPPIFHYTVSIFYRIFGISYFSSRLTSLSYSILLQLFIYLFAKDILENRKIGLLSQIIFSLSSLVIILSINAMMDTASMFFFFAVIYFYLKGLKKDVKYFYVGGLFLALTFLTKWNGVIAAPIVFLYLLLTKRKLMKHFFLSLFLSFILVLPYILLAYKAGFLFLPLKSSVVTPAYEEKDPLINSIEGWIYHLEVLNSWYFDLPLFIISFVSLYFFVRHKHEKFRLFLIWFLVVYLFFTFVPNKNRRFVMLLLPSLIYPTSSLLLKMRGWIKIILLIFIFIGLFRLGYVHLEKVFRYSFDYNQILQKTTGNVLIAADQGWFHSSTFMFYHAQTNRDFKYKVMRPCALATDVESRDGVLKENNISSILMTEPTRDEEVENVNYVKNHKFMEMVDEFESHENKVTVYRNLLNNTGDKNCNYICLIEDWLCSNYSTPSEVLR